LLPCDRPYMRHCFFTAAGRSRAAALVVFALARASRMRIFIRFPLYASACCCRVLPSLPSSGGRMPAVKRFCCAQFTRTLPVLCVLVRLASCTVRLIDGFGSLRMATLRAGAHLFLIFSSTRCVAAGRPSEPGGRPCLKMSGGQANWVVAIPVLSTMAGGQATAATTLPRRTRSPHVCLYAHHATWITALAIAARVDQNRKKAAMGLLAGLSNCWRKQANARGGRRWTRRLTAAAATWRGRSPE